MHVGRRHRNCFLARAFPLLVIRSSTGGLCMFLPEPRASDSKPIKNKKNKSHRWINSLRKTTPTRSRRMKRSDTTNYRLFKWKKDGFSKNFHFLGHCQLFCKRSVQRNVTVMSTSGSPICPRLLPGSWLPSDHPKSQDAVSALLSSSLPLPSLPPLTSLPEPHENQNALGKKRR